MGSDWKSIGGLLEGIIDYRGRTPPKSDQGIPCISAANVKSGRIDLSSTSYVSQETYDEWATRGFSKSGDVIITTEAPVGEVAEMPGDQIYLLTRRVMALQPNPKLLHNRYLLFALQSPYVKRELNMISRGTTVPRVLKTDITDIEIRVPSLAEQKAIAHILGSLDDKIELNRQINATLEAIAQALFKSWFVDFDPVIDNALSTGNPIPQPLQARAEARKALGDQRQPLPEVIQKQFCDRFVFNDDLGWIPEGWELKTLSNAADLWDSKRVPLSKNDRSSRNGPFAYYGDSGIVDYVDDYIFDGEYLLISEDGENLRSRKTPIAFVARGKFWVNNHAHVLTGTNNVCNQHIMLLFRTLDINPYITGAVQPKLNQASLKQIPFLFSSRSILDRFTDSVGPFYQKIYSNEDEYLSLASLRDTLLPKLLSGQLRIPEAEKRVAEAL